jgi:hypothetical protein
MKLKYSIIILVLFTQSVLAQSTQDSIDIKFDVCIDTSFASNDMLLCIEDAYYHWNDKLDSTYNYLLIKSDSTYKYNLINAQESWSKYFENEILLWNSFHENIAGPRWGNAAWNYDRYYLMIRLMRARTKELETYYLEE